MKLKLQYFAQSSGTPTPQSSAAQSSGSQATPQSSSSSQATQSSSSSGKTYTQSEVNRIANEAVADKIQQARADQKKLDSMSITQLKEHNKKVQKQKLNKIMAENKKYKHDAKARKALQATTKALANAHIPNAASLAKLAMDFDPDARSQKVKTIIDWLKDFKSSYKDKLMTGKREPQTGGNAGYIPSSNKGKKLNPFQEALELQKKQGR